MFVGHFLTLADLELNSVTENDSKQDNCFVELYFYCYFVSSVSTELTHKNLTIHSNKHVFLILQAFLRNIIYNITHF